MIRMASSLKEIQARIFDKVNPAVNFSVRRYVSAIGLFVSVVVFGLVSTVNLGVDLLPTVNFPVVAITVPYVGATPAVVDQQVTQVIEGSISTLAGITDIASDSTPGQSRIIVTLTASTDKNIAMSQISARVNSLAKSLPTNIGTPTVQTFDPNATPILQFGVAAEAISQETVGDWVTSDLSPRLERIEGVANVLIAGAPVRQFQVLLNPNKLAVYKLNPQTVSTAISDSALNQPIGSISTTATTLTFTTENLPSGTDAISETLVDSATGVRVGDLGAVRDVSSAPNDIVRVNGQPSILLSIQKTIESNAVSVAKNVRNYLTQTAMPSGYSVVISNDTTGPITASVESTYRELFLTAIVVALICLLFLGKLNTTISVILAIPIALSASPVLFALAGFTFNLVSLLAMIVAIGIVVDDSIVVSENVERYRAMGYSQKDAVLRGASEVFSAVVAASLSLLAVLLPVSFLGGVLGQYIMQFSLGLAAAVFFSLIEAIFFLTVRMAYTPESRTFSWRDFAESWGLLGPALRWGWNASKRGFFIVAGLAGAAALMFFQWWWWLLALPAWPLVLGVIYYGGRILLSGLQALTTTLHTLTEKGLDAVREAYVRSLDAVMKFGAWILGAMGVVLVATVAFIAPQIPFSFVPQSDAGTLVVNVRFPRGSLTSQTNNASGRVEAWLNQQPEVETLQTDIAGGGSTGSPGVATITVQLVPVERRRSTFTLVKAWRDSLASVVKDWPAARLRVGAGGFGGISGTGTQVSFVLITSDLGVLSQANEKALDVIQADPWVQDVQSDLSQLALEDAFHPDPERLRGTGISPATLATTMQTYATGVQASTVQVGSKSYNIQVQIDPQFLKGTESLLNLPVYSPTLQSNLTAGQLGSFTLSPSSARVQRTNRIYSTVLDINLNPGAPPPLAFQKLVTADLAKAGILAMGVGFIPESNVGPSSLAAQLVEKGPIAFLLAVFLAYLVMAAQFNSWRYPVYLLLPVPLALVGALWLVFVSGAGLDIFGVMGMLMLIGLSAKNAIIYLDFVAERLDLMPLREALIEAARLRFRPIVMTTLTVLVISFPLIFNGGQGSEFGQKMGLVMLGGIVSSAVLTFFVVPAAFWLFERRRHQETVLGIEPPND